MKFPLCVFSVGVVLACVLAGCAQSPVGSESSTPAPPSSAPEASMSSEAVSSEVPSEAPPEPVSSEIPSSDTPAPPVSQKTKPPPPASTPEVTQNPETGDSLGNPSNVTPPSWDQPGADAEKEVLALARKYLLTLPDRDPNVESVAINGEALGWNLKEPYGPIATIEFIVTTVGRTDSTSLQYPAGESKPCVYEEYRLLSSGWEFLGDGVAFQNVNAPKL